MPRVTSTPAPLVWTNVYNIDTPLKPGTKLQLIPVQPTEEHEKLMQHDGLDHKKLVKKFYRAFEKDIDYTVHATVVKNHRYDYTHIQYKSVLLLCKMKGDNDDWEAITFLDVNGTRDMAKEPAAQKLLDTFPEWAKVKASPTARPKVHRKFDATLRKKLAPVFRKLWRPLRSIMVDYDSKRGASNHYHKRCIDETILPTIRYLKRSLNVWGQSLIDDCTDDRVYENDDVWIRGQLGTDAYFEDERSFVGDRKTIV